MECYEILCHEDLDTAHLWPQLCGFAFRNESLLRFKLINNLVDEFYILEQLGFIVSHETKEEIMVRVEGGFIDCDFEYVFCIDESEHSYEV